MQWNPGNGRRAPVPDSASLHPGYDLCSRRRGSPSPFQAFVAGAADLVSFGVSCPSRAHREYHLVMRVATGTVVNGTIIVDDPEFKDGTDVFILTREREDEVHLSPEELAELEAGIAEADRGEMIPGDEFFARLRRYQ